MDIKSAYLLKPCEHHVEVSPASLPFCEKENPEETTNPSPALWIAFMGAPTLISHYGYSAMRGSITENPTVVEKGREAYNNQHMDLGRQSS